MTGIIQINDTINMLDRITQENANEANSLLDISKELEEIAKKLVIDAENKKF